MTTPLAVFVFVVAGAAVATGLAFLAALVSAAERIAAAVEAANALEKDRQLSANENVRTLKPGGPRGPRRPPAGKP
jgi:hypothetical protein